MIQITYHRLVVMTIRVTKLNVCRFPAIDCINIFWYVKIYAANIYFFCFRLYTRESKTGDWAGTRMTRDPWIHSRYHYTPRFPTPFTRHGTQVNSRGIWSCDLQFTTSDFITIEPPMSHNRVGYYFLES